MPRGGLSLLLTALALSACGPVPGESTPYYGGGPAVTPRPRATGPASAWPLLAAARDRDGRAVGDDRRATIVVVFASWCGHCRVELDELAVLLASRDDARVIGVNFRHHEEYDDRGSSSAVDEFVQSRAPWLRVVPAGAELFDALGGPAKIPALFVYDASGALVASYQRRDREPPAAAELSALLDGL